METILNNIDNSILHFLDALKMSSVLFICLFGWRNSMKENQKTSSTFEH